MRHLYYRFRAVVVTLLLRHLPRYPSLIFKGPGSVHALCDQLVKLGYRRVLLVTDQVLLDTGVLDGVRGQLASANLDVHCFADITPDPDFNQVRGGVAAIDRHGCEAVVAVGGGSVLDAAKMMAMLQRNPGPLARFDGVQKFRRRGLPVFAAPTTAGTGSEASPAAIITDPDTHQKVVVVDSKMVPGFVALDAQLTRSMPPAVTAATGMDALTHAIEAYLSRAATEATDEYARVAVRLIFLHLPRAFRHADDLEARDGMCLAAYYAATAFSRTSVGYVHGIAHQLGRLFGTPHGNANAMVLPEVLQTYGSYVHTRLAELALAAGLVPAPSPAQSPDSAAQAARFIRAVVELRSGLEMPLLPRGLKPEDLPGIVASALAEAGRLYPVPRYLSALELGSIVRGLLPATQPQQLELRRHG